MEVEVEVKVVRVRGRSGGKNRGGNIDRSICGSRGKSKGSES